LIKKAYVFSAKVHQGQVRKSGEPYLMHPLEVSGLLADMRLDEHALAAGILHDTVEDTVATVEDLRALFGNEVADIVDGVTKLSNMPYATSHERAAENFRRMVVAMSKDIRVILVKLADRLHNMRTLEHMKPEKQEKIAQETLDIYAPLANRLGIHWIKAELQDNCLKYVHPKDEALLREKLASTDHARSSFIDEVKTMLTARMKDNGIPAEVHGRVKHLYSVWMKMKQQGIEFEDLNDIVAFRIVTDSIPHCYEAFGYCHATWRPVPGRFKDFIASPKPNGYQSLHTTVLGPEGQRIEIQLRTKEMDDIAENGIAAHWAYKEGKSPKAMKDGQQFAWLRELMNWQRELSDPSEFMASVKLDLFGDAVYVFTPRGEVKELSSGATPVDFAFAIHSEVGNHCQGARVNGRMVPLRYRLKNGDTVEIITTPNQHPNKDWLGFVKTARAKNRINHFLRQQQRERAIKLGEEILEKELKRYGRSLAKVMKSGALQSAFEASHKYHKTEDVIAAIGYGKLTAQIVIRKLLPPEEVDKGPREEKEPKSRLGQLIAGLAKKSPSGVAVAGLDDVLIRFAKCCHAVPGDPIIGFVSRGRGVTVHNQQCEKAMQLDPARKVPVTWDTKSKVERAVQLRIITDDRPGILATISQSFTGAGANILNANCRARRDQRAINTFTVAVRDASQLRTIMKDIEALAGIHSVERLQV